MDLIIRNLYKSYGKKQVLENASFIFREGEIYSVLGRNGAGKTTLFNCICENVEYSAGEIKLDKNGELLNLNFDDVGIVAASPILPEFLTGYEFVSFFAKLNQDKCKELDYYFDLVRIDDADRHRLIKHYSYGMKNKLQLLCCLIRNPKVILLDEPLSSFDVVVSHDIKELLIQMKETHIIIMATHIMQLAKDISDEIVILSEGRLMLPTDGELKDDEFKKIVIEELNS